MKKKSYLLREEKSIFMEKLEQFIWCLSRPFKKSILQSIAQWLDVIYLRQEFFISFQLFFFYRFLKGKPWSTK